MWRGRQARAEAKGQSAGSPRPRSQASALARRPAPPTRHQQGPVDAPTTATAPPPGPPGAARTVRLSIPRARESNGRARHVGSRVGATLLRGGDGGGWREGGRRRLPDKGVYGLLLEECRSSFDELVDIRAHQISLGKRAGPKGVGQRACTARQVAEPRHPLAGRCRSYRTAP